MTLESPSDTEAPTFLDRLGERGRQALEEAGSRRQHRRGATLFREGDSTDGVIVLLSGTLKLTKLSLDGREIILGLRGPGEVLGELSAIDGSPRSATGVFLTKGSALHLSAKQFNGLVDSEHSVAAATLRTVAHRLREASDRQLEFGTSDALTRVCARLVDLAQDLPPSADGTIAMRSPLSQQELADWAGVSRDAVVRVLKTARELGWLDTGRQTFVLRDLDAIRAQATSG